MWINFELFQATRPERTSSRPHRFIGNEFSTIKTSRIVSQEQREHNQGAQQIEQFRGYKRMRHQHQKQLKQVSFAPFFFPLHLLYFVFQFEERCRNEKLELRSKLEREYNIFQEQITSDNNRLLEKHRREVAERVKHNQTCFKKLERDQEDEFENELKRFQHEQTKQYRTKKDTFKRVRTLSFFPQWKNIFLLAGNSQFFASIEE